MKEGEKQMREREGRERKRRRVEKGRRRGEWEASYDGRERRGEGRMTESQTHRKSLRILLKLSFLPTFSLTV